MKNINTNRKRIKPMHRIILLVLPILIVGCNFFPSKNSKCIKEKRIVLFGDFDTDLITIQQGSKKILSKIIQFHPLQAISLDTTFSTGDLTIFINNDTSFVIQNCDNENKVFIIEKYKNYNRILLKAVKDTIFILQ